MNIEGSSPKPRSLALLPPGDFLSSSQKPQHQSHTKPLPPNNCIDSSPSLELSLPRRPKSDLAMPSACFLRIDRSGGSLSEDQAVQQLVRRVGSFLQTNRNIYATESKSENNCWKCETLWIRFRVLVIDGSTIEIQRRLGCSYKLRQLQLDLWEHCSNSNTTSARRRPSTRPPVRCAAQPPLDANWLDEEVERMVELLQSLRTDQQLLALEAVADCPLLQPRLLSYIEQLLCQSSATTDPKVSRVAQCVLKGLYSAQAGREEGA